MSTIQINTADDVYQFVERLKTECERHSANELLECLNSAIRMGSSGLEIMGALRKVLLTNTQSIQKLLGSEAEDQARKVVEFVDRAFGR